MPLLDAYSYFDWKLIWDLGITGGNKAKVGYYAGLLVELSNMSEVKTECNVMSGFSVLCCGSLDCLAMG
jgi:hypothetical protein